ncbi:1693_t:CDS:2, partial [Cetraspora pellucida]
CGQVKPVSEFVRIEVAAKQNNFEHSNNNQKNENHEDEDQADNDLEIIESADLHDHV